jgi:hypothetical protein
MVLVAAADPRHFTFATGEYIIKMDVRFLDPYVGERLVFYDTADPGKKICVRIGESEPCPEHFVGAVATVTLTVRRASDKAPREARMREYVTLTAQSLGLPPRPPFEKTQSFTRGIITDLQVFGYDESLVAEGERTAARKGSKDLFRLFRQELFLNREKEPFATIEWTKAGRAARKNQENKLCE